MSRRKSDALQVRYKPVQDYKGSEPPEWTDMLRGCMIAIIEKTRVLWDVHFRSAKERILDHLSEVAGVLKNQDARMNEWAVLEKWCWMMEMYARSVEFQIPWRYANSMNFLSSTPSNGNAGCGNVYLGCLSKERFIQLTLHYGTPEEQVATTLMLTKKFKRFAAGTGLFTNEMEAYAKLVGNGPVNGPTTVTAVPILASSTPLQIIASAEILKDAQSTPRRKAKATRSNSSVAPVTTIAEALSVGQLIATSITSGTPVFKQEPLEFSSENSAFTLVKNDVSEGGNARSGTPTDSWKTEATQTLIDSIKTRPALWNLGNANYKITADRKKQLAEVALLLAASCGTHHPEHELATKWAKLKETFNQHHKKVKAGAKNLPEWEFYTKMLFLAQQEEASEPEPSTSSSATAVIVTSDDMPLQRLLNSMPVPSESPIGAKRPRLSSPGSIAKKNETQIAVSTWVPPKEDAIAAAFQAVAAPTPVTAATAVVTSGAPLPTFFMEPMKEAQPQRKTQLNGVGKRQHNNHETSSSNHNREEARGDRWFHLGRLVEMTCRDLETKDEAVAVVLQKELGELLCKYQLKCIKK